MGTYDAPRPRNERRRMTLESVARRAGELAVAGGGKWRDYYLSRVRNEGRARPGCGEGKAGEDEKRIVTRYATRCAVCGGKLEVGDPVIWNMTTKKVRHAPTGWKKE